MKKRTFLVAAVIVITGVVAYKVCRYLYKTTSKECNKKSTSNDTGSAERAKEIGCD